MHTFNSCNSILQTAPILLYFFGFRSVPFLSPLPIFKFHFAAVCIFPGHHTSSLEQILIPGIPQTDFLYIKSTVIMLMLIRLFQCLINLNQYKKYYICLDFPELNIGIKFTIHLDRRIVFWLQ